MLQITTGEKKNGMPLRMANMVIIRAGVKLEDANIDIDSFENIELIIKEKLLDKVNITN